MFNVLTDSLPDDYEGYAINSDYRIGVQITLLMEDDDVMPWEKLEVAADLLFGSDDGREIPDIETAEKGITWFLSGWQTDNESPKEKARRRRQKIAEEKGEEYTDEKADSTPKMSFINDQWRIYSAFLSQYSIDLTKTNLHFWQFMGLLTTLDECAFTRVIDLRTEELNKAKMSKEEYDRKVELKAIYGITPQTDPSEEEEKLARKQEFLKMMGYK